MNLMECDLIYLKSDNVVVSMAGYIDFVFYELVHGFAISLLYVSFLFHFANWHLNANPYQFN